MFGVYLMLKIEKIKEWCNIKKNIKRKWSVKWMYKN